MYLNALRIKLLVLMLLAVSGQVSGYEGERVDEGFLASWAHPQNHNDNPLEQTEPKSPWNVVAFQSKDERHKCQMSLDDDGLGQYGIQHVGDLVWLSIPDQGIEGVYAVTDIRSLKPPKIPSGDEVDGEAGYSYITGIFEHTSEDVWKLIFEGGEKIEVTGSHPFYDIGAGNTVEVTHSVSGLSAATIDIVKNYGFKTREAANLFLDDLGSEPVRTFLESAGENGVKAWEKLINTGLRTNIKWLETTSKWIDDGLEIIATATKVSIKKAGVEVGEISGDLLKVRYPHYGGDVICHSTKTTTIVGRFEGNISIIKDSQLWKYGENPSGVNILNDPNWTWPINEQWLMSAANRGDIIRVVSDPTNINNIWKNGIVGGEKTTFGLEVDFLDNLGYTFDAMKFQFVN